LLTDLLTRALDGSGEDVSDADSVLAQHVGVDPQGHGGISVAQPCGDHVNRDPMGRTGDGERYSWPIGSSILSLATRSDLHVQADPLPGLRASVSESLMSISSMSLTDTNTYFAPLGIEDALLIRNTVASRSSAGV